MTSEAVKSGRNWMITLPEEHYSQEEVESGLAAYDFIGQLEVSDSGYRHWQIYIENKTPIRFETLRAKFGKGHFEPRRSTSQQCVAYVSKVRSSIGVKVSNGKFDNDDGNDKTQSATDMLRDMILLDGKSVNEVMLACPEAFGRGKALLDLAQARDAIRFARNTRELEVSYIHGPAGVGKTTSVYEKHGYKAVYSVVDYRHPFDMYDGESVLLLDEFAGQFELEFMLKLLDKFPLQLPARYANRWAGFEHVYVLSNSPLRTLRHHYGCTDRQWAALTRRIHHYIERTSFTEAIEHAINE